MYYIKYGHTYEALKYCLRKQLTGFWNKAVVCRLSSLDSTAASLRFHRDPQQKVSALSLMNPGSKFHSCTLTMKSVSLVALEYSHIYLSATQTLSHCILTSLSILTLHSYILLDLISNSLSLSLCTVLSVLSLQAAHLSALLRSTTSYVLHVRSISGSNVWRLFPIKDF